jgi:hypothetical protein
VAFRFGGGSEGGGGTRFAALPCDRNFARGSSRSDSSELSSPSELGITRGLAGAGVGSWELGTDDKPELGASEASRRSCDEGVFKAGGLNISADEASGRAGVVGSTIGSEGRAVGSLFVRRIGLKKSVTFLLLEGG